MADKLNDPIEMWHNLLGDMEKGFNAFANQAMASPDFSKVVNQVGGVSASAQKQIGELMEKYLTSMNLPSRMQMASFGERLQAIEGRLDEITALLRQLHSNSVATESASPALPEPPKPPRTKQPPAASRHSK